MTVEQLDKTVGADFSLGLQVTFNLLGAAISSDGKSLNALHSLHAEGPGNCAFGPFGCADGSAGALIGIFKNPGDGS